MAVGGVEVCKTLLFDELRGGHTQEAFALDLSLVIVQA